MLPYFSHCRDITLFIAVANTGLRDTANIDGAECEKVCFLRPHVGAAFHCGVCMIFLCLCGFSFFWFPGLYLQSKDMQVNW